MATELLEEAQLDALTKLRRSLDLYWQRSCGASVRNPREKVWTALTVDEVRAFEALAEYRKCRDVAELLSALLRHALVDIVCGDGLEQVRGPVRRILDPRIVAELEADKEAAYDRR